MFYYRLVYFNLWDSLQPRAVTTDHSLTTKMLALLNLSLCACLLVCVSVCPSVSRVCACARWKTPSQCCLNGHAVLSQPYSQLLAVEKHYKGTERTRERLSSGYIQQQPADQLVTKTLCRQSVCSLFHSDTNRPALRFVIHLSWV